MNHEQHVRESRPEISPISVVVPAGSNWKMSSQNWKLFTLTTSECRRPCTWDSRVWPWPHQGHQTDLWATWAGSHSKPEDSDQSHPPGTSRSSGQCLCLSECICSVTVSNWGESEQTFSPRVNKTIQHLSGLLYEVWLVWVVRQLVVRLQVEDHIQRLPVVGDLLIEASQVELVLNVVLVHFAEELISSQTTEPRYPGDLRGVLNVPSLVLVLSHLFWAGHFPLERRIDLGIFLAVSRQDIWSLVEQRPLIIPETASTVQ